MPSSFTRAPMVLGTSPRTSLVHAVPPSATQMCAAGRGGVIVPSGRSPAIQADDAPSNDPSDARAMFVMLDPVLVCGLKSHPRRSEPSTRPANSLRVLLQPAPPTVRSDADPANSRWPMPNTKSPPGPKTTRPDVSPWDLVNPSPGDTYSGWVWYSIMPGSSVGRGRLFDIFLALCSAYCSKPFP